MSVEFLGFLQRMLIVVEISFPTVETAEVMQWKYYVISKINNMILQEIMVHKLQTYSNWIYKLLRHFSEIYYDKKIKVTFLYELCFSRQRLATNLQGGKQFANFLSNMW